MKLNMVAGSAKRNADALTPYAQFFKRNVMRSIGSPSTLIHRRYLGKRRLNIMMSCGIILNYDLPIWRSSMG